MRTTLITRRGLAALLGAAAMTFTALAGSAHGEEDKGGTAGTDPITDPVPGDFRSWDELFATQERLNAAADLISTARGREDGLDDGFSGLVADPTTRRVELFWRGTAPPRVQEAIDAARRDVPVATRSARFSERELLGHGERLLAERVVTGVSTAADGSGLDVSVSVSEEEARRAPAIRDAAVPLTIAPFVQPELVYNRQDDIAPYWGGAAWGILGSTPRCSTGFAVRLGTGAPGMTTMLSAAHCADNFQIATDGGGDIMGSVSHKDASRDTLLITTSAEGKVYTGGTSSSTRIPVKGKQPSAVGNYVCTSGAFTGHHCPVKVNAVNLTVVFSDGTKVSSLVQATRTAANTPAVGKGDSGGPVYSQTAVAQNNTALAMGTITGGSGFLGACQLSSKCYQTVYYVDITKTLQHYTNSGLSLSLILG